MTTTSSTADVCDSLDISTLSVSEREARGKIVVCGRQKTGKSTLVQALTNVDLNEFIQDGGHTRVPSIHRASFANNVDIVDTPGINSIHGLGQSMLNNLLPNAIAVIMVIEAQQLETDATAADIASLIAQATCPILVLVNKIDQVLASCVGNPNHNKKQGFKDCVEHDFDSLTVIADPIEKLAHFEKQFWFTVSRVKSQLANADETDRVRMMSSMLSENPLDLRVMWTISESLSKVDTSKLWAQIWTAEDVVQYSSDMYDNDQ
jgi:small GTP-binding protein